MDTKPRNPKNVKMEQKNVKINLDNTGTTTQLKHTAEECKAILKYKTKTCPKMDLGVVISKI